MDIKTFKLVAPSLPSDIAVLMRGPTGVGKSHLAAAIARELDLPFIDVRGSTMDEAKVGGLPDMKAVDEKKVATFVVPSWFKTACDRPCVIMLDELNRSMPQVMQSFFQIVLDRELGNNAEGEAVRLHPETRVVAAVNHGNEYDVNDMDPALLRRFWVVDLDPSAQDWIEWAGANGIDPLTIDFVRQHPEHLRVDPGSVEPGTVIPTPASWHRLDESLQYMGMNPSEQAGSRPDGLYALASGFVGTEAAIAYSEFIARYERVISADDVLEGRISDDRSKELSAAEGLAVIDKIINWTKDNTLTKKNAKNVAAFLEQRGGEQLVHFWNALSKTQELPNIKAMHSLIGNKVIETIKAARDLSS